LEKIKQIIRYRLVSGMGERQVARALKVSRTVVCKYVEAFRQSGLKLDGLEGMPDSELAKALYAVTPAIEGCERLQQLRQRFPGMLTQLKKTKGMTLQLLWERYREEHPDGYQYSQYCYHFQKWCDEPELYMHIEHKAGEQMFVDWAGDKLEVINAANEQPWALELFVAILPASELTFVQARETQQETDWLRGNEAAMNYFGGVPQAIVPDYVPRNIIGVMCPATLCGQGSHWRRLQGWSTRSWQHNAHTEFSQASKVASSLHTGLRGNSAETGGSQARRAACFAFVFISA
jgi:hypothetical protein